MGDKSWKCGGGKEGGEEKRGSVWVEDMSQMTKKGSQKFKGIDKDTDKIESWVETRGWVLEESRESAGGEMK